MAAGSACIPPSYQAVFKLWHDKQLTLRVAYHLCAPKPGSELADLQNLTQLLPQGFGDDMLHFNGPGEILIWADWTDGDITPDGKAKLAELLRWAASKGYTIQLHWNPNRTVARPARCRRRHREGLSGSRSPMDRAASVQRLGRQPEADEVAGPDLGRAGRPYFGGERLQREVGVEQARRCRRSRPRCGSG